jgi:TRAP-type uncharacterized transport system substrate-binding protein
MMDTPQTARRPSRMRWIALLVTITALLAAIWWVLERYHPLPPRLVVMSTGLEGSAYAEFAARYREALARVGIELRLVPSAGAVENLARLRDSKSEVSVGFVGGGLAEPTDGSALVSLGTLFYEPLWFFVAGETPDVKLQSLAGKRMSIGPEGSGTRAFALRLLALLGIGTNFATLLPYPPVEAADRLLGSEIQAAIVLTSWDSPAIRRLAASPAVRLMSFPRADAYVALYPYFNKLTLPMGVGNMAENRPSADVTLIATKANLVVRKDLHPAIQYLLLDAAREIHGGPGIFQKAGQFPAAEAIDIPLSEHAHTFYTSGRPFLQRYLPFWLAVFAGQLLVLLVPVVGVLYPLLRLAPALYGWSMRRRIFRLYGELKFLDDELDRRGSDAVADVRSRLDRLEERTNQMKVPLAFRQLLYTLRLHIGIVRQRLK